MHAACGLLCAGIIEQVYPNISSNWGALGLDALVLNAVGDQLTTFGAPIGLFLQGALQQQHAACGPHV